MSEALQPVFAIEKIYLKDLSVEAPNTPEIFSEREAPTVEVDIHSEAREVQPALFEVVLKVTITAPAKVVIHTMQHLVPKQEFNLFGFEQLDKTSIVVKMSAVGGSGTTPFIGIN